ncbi:MAG: cation transporter [Nonlabens sp.]
MRYLLLLLLVTGSAFAKAQSQKTMDKYEIQVDGLGCPFCAYGLEKKFKEFKGIKDVAIDIETGDFSFLYPSSNALTMEQVTEQVKKAGYTPNLATITRADGRVETNEVIKDDLANLKVETFMVHGKCGMCKARIEGAMSAVSSVKSSIWDVKSKELTVSFNPALTTLEELKEIVAGVGHDTASTKSTDDTYENLPACCKYERVK